MQNDQQKKSKHQLLMEHLDSKMSILALFSGEPSHGWINAVRLALRMSYRQLAIRLGITTQHARHLEQQEQAGTIMLKTCREIATSLNMRFVYGFVSKEGSLADIVEKQTYLVAEKLVRKNMINLKESSATDDSIEKATETLAAKLKAELPKNLWNRHK